MFLTKFILEVTMGTHTLTLENFMDRIHGDGCIEFLRHEGLLLKELCCENCLRPMKLKEKNVRVTSDKQVWVCRKCHTSKSIRHGSFFKVIIT